MPTSLSGRDFLRLLDFTTEEIEYLLKLSREFKNLKLTGTPHRYLEGRAGCRRFRAGVERPDHRVASHPDAR